MTNNPSLVASNLTGTPLSVTVSTNHLVTNSSSIIGISEQTQVPMPPSDLVVTSPPTDIKITVTNTNKKRKQKIFVLQKMNYWLGVI